MSRKKFFYVSALSFFCLAGTGSGLVAVFLGTEDVSSMLLALFIGSMFGVPAILFLGIAFFAHSAEPFIETTTTPVSGLVASLGLLGILVLTAYYWYLFV